MTGEQLHQVGARRAGRDIALQLISKVANLALGTAVTLVLVRGLGDQQFGRWSTIAAVVQLLGFFGDLGLEQIAVRKAAEEPEREEQWIGALVTLRLALAVPSILAALGVLLLIAQDDTMRLASVAMAATLLLAPLASTRVVLQLRVRNTTNANLELANGIIWALAVFGLAAAGAGLVAYAAAFAGALAVTSLAQVAFALRATRVRLRGTRSHWPQLIRVGFPVAVSSLLIMAYGRIDQVLVFEINGERAAGLYGAAYRVLERGYLLPGTIMGTLFPLLAASHTKDAVRMRELVQTAFDLLLLLALPIFTFTLVTASPLVLLLFGEDFAPAATALAVLMASYVVSSIGYLCGYLIIVYSLQKRFVRYALAGLVLNVALNLALLDRYGFTAAAWTTLATEVLVVGMSLRAVMQTIEDPLQMDRPLRVAAAAGAMALAILGLRAVGAPIGVLIAAAGPAYAAALLSLHAVDPAQLRTLLRR